MRVPRRIPLRPKSYTAVFYIGNQKLGPYTFTAKQVAQAGDPYSVALAKAKELGLAVMECISVKQPTDTTTRFKFSVTGGEHHILTMDWS